MQMVKIKKLPLFKTCRKQHDWVGFVEAFQSTEKIEERTVLSCIS